jgi:hypothetical protein
MYYLTKQLYGDNGVTKIGKIQFDWNVGEYYRTFFPATKSKLWKYTLEHIKGNSYIWKLYLNVAQFEYLVTNGKPVSHRNIIFSLVSHDKENTLDPGWVASQCIR